MQNFKFTFFILIIILISCNEDKVENSGSVTFIDKKDTTKTQKNEIIEILPVQIADIIKLFPNLKQITKFSYYEELPDALYQLKDNEINRLKLNEKYSKESQQYIDWYVYGKTENKDYFSLFLFQTLESVCLYQANYSKKDSSLIQLFLLSEWLNPCEEVSSTETIRKGEILEQTTINEYEEWTNEENSKGVGFVETIKTKFICKETGKIDSLSSSKKVITKKLK